MTNVFGRLFGRRTEPSPGEIAYAKATASNRELVSYMRQASESTDPARALMADVWQQRNNIPYLTTVYQASKEMTAPGRAVDPSK